MRYKEALLRAMNDTSLHFNHSGEIEFPRGPLVGILLVLSFGTCLGNVLVCIAMWVQPALQTAADLPIASLAIADLLAGFVAMPAYMLKKLVARPSVQRVVCDVFRFSYFLSSFASVLGLCVISAERLVTIKHPLTFRTKVSHRRVLSSLVIVWLDVVIVSSLPLVSWTGEDGERADCRYNPTPWWSTMVIISNILLPFLFMAGCYWYINGVARHHRKQISVHDHFACARPNSRGQKKANRTVLIIVGVFIVTWFPSGFYYFLKQVCPGCFSSSFTSVEGIFNAVVKLMTFMGSFANPVIYCWRRREFRQAFLKILRIRRNVNGATNMNYQTSASRRFQTIMKETGPKTESPSVTHQHDRS